MRRDIAAIVGVFICAALGWAILGSSMLVRTHEADNTLRSEISELWGTPLTQRAPSAMVHYQSQVEHERWEDKGAQRTRIVSTEEIEETAEAALVASSISADLDLDQRRKGLLWYATYRVNFSGIYTFEHVTEQGESIDSSTPLEIRSPR